MFAELTATSESEVKMDGYDSLSCASLLKYTICQYKQIISEITTVVLYLL